MKKYIFVLGIGFLLFIISISLLIIDSNHYQYYNHLTITNYHLQTITLESKLHHSFRIKEDSLVSILIKESDTISKGNLVIKGLYYDQFVNLELEIKEGFYYQELIINLDSNINYDLYRRLVNDGLHHLRAKKIYNYSLLFKPVIKIYINKEDRHLIKLES